MGYLNNQVVTIDAILTKKGRELLARGDGSFNITQFALADDEIDYTMYNPTHPSGAAYYGEAIENMPLMEAFPDETQIMKYKLATLPRGTAKMPILDVGQTSIVIKQNAEKGLTPQTLNYLDNNQVYESSGYTFTVSDVRLFSTFVGSGIDTANSQTLNSTTTNGTNVSKTVIGTTLNMRATGVNTLFGSNSTLYATLTIVGRDSGARLQIPVSITKTTT
ncbi:hypothetical protein N9864_00390 [bacterium]|jgi:hypothetical protein|nr:hypothetical protein [bacterium]MDB4276959.1 hypothetical protein [bacterium]MDB4319886.1 hypothetical protein [bacterium]MDB9992637.1 hypothetical protein [bacterium]|tara:strand:+ start:306 stop:965 length:660 start_codon:yes stop_codon:yes gene_type:complete